MATIYKRNKKRKGEPYSIQYVDHEGRRRTAKGFTDKGLTEQLAAKLENETMLRKRGLIDVQAERLADHRTAPIEVHLTAFAKSVGAKNNTGKYVKKLMMRVRRITEGCAFETIGDIRREAVEDFLVEFREKEDFGHRTHNHYVQAINTFCKWLVKTQRLQTNPVAEVPRLNAATDVRHPRRALTSAEVSRLIESARQSGVEVQKYTGEQRARLYLLAYMTGLRKGELASLTSRSFQLDAKQPFLVVEAGASKHRRRDVLPLHPTLIPVLRETIAGMGEGEALFPNLAGKKTWIMVKSDLERVGIPYHNAEGIADFHAAGRHTHITELLRNGASIVEAQKLARHSDVRMTMRYTHIGMEDQAKALASLPAPFPPAPELQTEQPALQMRCISCSARGHFVSPIGTNPYVRKRQNPCRSKGFGTIWRSLSTPDKVEAGGIEPPSCDPSEEASTCVSG